MRERLPSILIAIAAAIFLPGGGAGAGTLSVIGVDPGDTLRLRAAPSAGAAEIGRIPPDADGIEPGEPANNLDWLSVTYAGITGFASTHYLAYGSRSEQERLPVRLECSGTEPFWGLDVGYRRAEADLVYAEKQARLALSEPERARGLTNPWLMKLTSRAGDGFLLITAEQCSDGMSDETYPFSLAFEIGGTLLKGCCAGRR